MMRTSPRSRHVASPEIFRQDGFYSFTLPQQAALTIVLHHAVDRSSDPEDRDREYEDITASTPFQKRYALIVRHANRSGAYGWCGENADDVKFWEEARKKLKNCCKTIRNYFSHYLHTPDAMNALANDTVFMNVLERLEGEAVRLWRQHRAAWEQAPLHASSAEYSRQQEVQHIHQWDWQTVSKMLTVYEKQPPIPVHRLLLFIAMFATKGAMERFLRSWHVFKGDDPEITRAKEILTALCLRESHDTLSTEAATVTAMTILDRFAHRLGLRQTKEGGPTLCQPRPAIAGQVPDMVRSFSKTFYIRMLVAVIEAADILPDLRIARTFEGKPSFADDQRHRDVYIGQNSVAIRFAHRRNEHSSQETVLAQLGLHALKTIVAAWLSGKERAVIQTAVISCAVQITVAMRNTDPPAKSLCGLPRRLLPDAPTPKEETAETLRMALKTRVDALKRHFFASQQSDHRKATAILWWINRRLPQELRLRKVQYDNALFALSGRFDVHLLQENLPKVPQKQCPFGGKTLHKMVDAADLEIMFRRVCSDFRATTQCITVDSPELAPLRELATLVRLRRVVKQPLDQGKAWTQFSRRFANFASPPAHVLWKRLKLLGHDTLKGAPPLTQGRIPIGRLLQSLEENSLVLERNLYAHSHGNGWRFSEKAMDCYNNDRLLLLAALRLASSYRGENISLTPTANFRYTAVFTVDVDGTSYRLEIDSAQARRSYVSLKKERLRHVIRCYWIPQNAGRITIPFVLAQATERNGGPPRCWMDAESDMERERRCMIQALLQWEKDMVAQYATTEGIVATDTPALLHSLGGVKYVEIQKLLDVTHKQDTHIDDYRLFRNWALHSAPKKPFASAPGELGRRFQQVMHDREVHKTLQRREGNKRAHMRRD